MDKSVDLPQQLTVITGGTEGIGYALAHEFAQNGHNLLLIARNEDKLSQCKLEIQMKFDVNVLTLSCDLSQENAYQKVLQILHEKNYHAENLINNVALGISGDFIEQDPAEVNKMLDLNIRTATNMMRCFLPEMVARNQGTILNVASVAGMLGLPYHALYSASKAYLITFTQALSQEVSHTNVNLSVLVPGPVNTGFHEKMGVKKSAYLKLMPMSPPQVVAKVAYNGVLTGQKFIVPGLFNMINVLGLKFLPHFMIRSIFGNLWRLGAPKKLPKAL